MVKSTLEFITLKAVHLSARDRRVLQQEGGRRGWRWGRLVPGVAQAVCCVFGRNGEDLGCWMNVLGKESIRIPGQRSRQKKRLGGPLIVLYVHVQAHDHTEESGEIF